MNPQYQIQDHSNHYRGTSGPETIMRLEIKVLTFLDGYHQEELEDKLKECLKDYKVYAKISSSTGNEMTVNPPLSKTFLKKYGKH